MSDDGFPKKRLRLTLTMDAHSSDELYHQLLIVAQDIDLEAAHGREERDVVSGGGWFYKVEIRDAEMTEDRYNAELMALVHARRAARSAAEPSGGE